MKQIKHTCYSIAGAAAVISLLAGCATYTPKATTEAIGPVNNSRWLEATGGHGTLMVFTAVEHVNDGDVVYSPHTPYYIFDQQGKLVQSVRNRIGWTDGNPMTVKLEAGTYLVRGQVEGKGWATVPTVISRNRLTVINLTRSGLAKADRLPEAEQVRLADGRVIGRRADPELVQAEVLQPLMVVD